MSSSSKSRSHVAHVEDAEDSGSSINGIEGTRKYAMSEAPMSPSKVKPNTGKSRSDRRPVNSRSSSAGISFNESDSHGSTSDRRGKPPSRRPSEKDYDEMRARERERRRERRLKEEEDNRRAEAAAAKAAAKAKAQAKAKDQDSRPLRKQRPTSLRQSATQPVVQQLYRRGHVVEDPANYGVQQPAISGNRPRAQTRPASYYAGQPIRPGPVPLNSMPWYAPQSQAPFPVGTFPPPHAWHGPGASPGGFAGPPPPSPVGHSAGYFDGGVATNPHSHLRQRFETRPSSAMEYQKPPPPPRPHAAIDYYNQDEFVDDPPHGPLVTRRPSRSRRADDDRKRMPPPEYIPIRPQSALPPSTPYRPPPSQRPPSRQNQSRPPPSHRRSVGFVDPGGYDDDDFLGDDGLFHDISPNASFEQRRAVVPRSRRSSVAYDHQDYDIVPATTGRGRRSSMYGSVALPTGGVSLDDKKYTDALKYQDAVSGGSQMPLTAESLRKASKRGTVPSSRSTRSSGSRDDSEYKRSNATGLTRTSYNSDDLTIKVSGGARLRLPGGAEIECEDGGDITLTTRPSRSRSGSDKASMIYPQLEDSRSRLGRKALPLPHRPRAPSQSDSQSRGYAPSHAAYDFPGGYF